MAELAPEGAEFVVDAKFRKAAMGEAGWMNANLRTTFEKIVKRAGLQAWPRLFHNLRASRETELVEAYPVQVVTSWLGNTPRACEFFGTFCQLRGYCWQEVTLTGMHGGGHESGHVV